MLTPTFRIRSPIIFIASILVQGGNGGLILLLLFPITPPAIPFVTKAKQESKCNIYENTLQEKRYVSYFSVAKLLYYSEVWFAELSGSRANSTPIRPAAYCYRQYCELSPKIYYCLHDVSRVLVSPASGLKDCEIY